MTEMPQEVRDVFETYPAAARTALGQVRRLIFDVAAAEGVTPLAETLKWGQPAYLAARKAGTTLRLGWSARRADVCGLYVHCQTNLVDRFRARFADDLAFEGDRAVILPLDAPLREAPLAQCIAMALTYHRSKAHG